MYINIADPKCRVIQNTFSGNHSPKGGGILLEHKTVAAIQGCIVAYSNGGGGIWWGAARTGDVVVSHSNVFGNVGSNYGGGLSDQTGTNGNISLDPLFADPENGDFHLMSAAGRWIDGAGWKQDDVTSPCIDAGDPEADYSNEPDPDGGRVNLGAYGNTEEASKSPE